MTQRKYELGIHVDNDPFLLFLERNDRVASHSNQASTGTMGRDESIRIWSNIETGMVQRGSPIDKHDGKQSRCNQCMTCSLQLAIEMDVLDKKRIGSHFADIFLLHPFIHFRSDTKE